MTKPKTPDFKAGIDLATLPEGAMLAGRWQGKPVLLANHQGKYCALSATCTHQAGPLEQGILANGEVHCPWHHARFSLATGEAIAAPAFSPLTRYGTRIRDGRLFITEPQPRSAPEAPAHTSRVVILGGGAGGYACAQWLLRFGFKGEITLVSDEADPPYDRTFCSKQYLSGEKSRKESLLVKSGRTAAAGDLNLRLGTKAQAIDAKGQSLLLESGEQLGYDILVLATGAQPKRAQWPGSNLPNVHVLRTLRDADALVLAARRARRVIVIGASFIGLEVAASLRQRKLAVHVVTPEDVPLKKLLGSDVGKMIQAVHEKQGVRFHFGRQVREFDGKRVTLDNGHKLPTDFVVAGIGVTPRTEIAQASGLSCAAAEEGGGVIVNAQLETSQPGIFAIGDIARYPDPHTGESIRVEHWVHAERQGQHVARIILGQAAPYKDVPFFWSAHFDTQLSYIGRVKSILKTRTEGSVKAREFRRYYQGPNKQKAFASCNRDQESLIEEAAWDYAVASEPAGR
jgi:NADPH-dependent 2,4-dienoyl-CoA reductase/sulfur reductase-like enzyme/nitrite reductase/ring-hydroxylating ferredoxin subunit